MADSAEHRFEVTNLRSIPLIIRNASASCGCTVPSWNRDPIAPGNKGFVDVLFKPMDEGPVNKSIVLEMNIDSTFAVLRIRGEVTK